jgi:hypothetical protein
MPPGFGMSVGAIHESPFETQEWGIEEVEGDS